jgi:hypothetical protein
MFTDYKQIPEANNILLVNYINSGFNCRSHSLLSSDYAQFEVGKDGDALTTI